MAVRFLRSKLSERIFSHVLEDARIMPYRLVKGLPPLASEPTKIAPLARHSAIGSTMPIKNLTFQSFKFAKVPERMPLGFLPYANNVLYNEAGYNHSSSFKGKSGSILIHGRRNFSSCPPEMDAGNKGPSGPETEKIYVVKGDSDNQYFIHSTRWRSELRAKIIKVIKVYAVVFCSINLVAFYYTVWDALCSSPYLFFFTVSGHILCFLVMLLIYLS